jgi:putative tryptophan/tyrosine transport system substrate-binding protein
LAAKKLNQIGRRDFITLLGGAAAAWPVMARAQQPTMPMVGYLSPGAEQPVTPAPHAFLNGLVERGYVQGRNVAIEYRWAENQYDRLSSLADELVRREVAVIFTAGGTPTALAAKAATETIPIVFCSWLRPGSICPRKDPLTAWR